MVGVANLSAQVRFLHLRIIDQRIRIALQHHVAVFQTHSPAGKISGPSGRSAPPAGWRSPPVWLISLSDLKHIHHQQRRQAPWRVHPGASGGVPIINAPPWPASVARRPLMVPSLLGFAFFQTGKNGKNPLDILFHMVLVLTGKGGQFQGFPKQSGCRTIAGLRERGKCPAHSPLSPGETRADHFPCKGHLRIRLLTGTNHSRNGPKGGAFPGTVGPDDGNDLAFLYCKADAVQGLDPAVGNPKVFYI
jgi:hypothetical protein